MSPAPTFEKGIVMRTEKQIAVDYNLAHPRMDEGEPRGCPTPGACSGLSEIARIKASALSDIAQIYGLLQEGRYDEADDYCMGAAAYYAPD